MKKRNLFLDDYEKFSYNEVVEDIVSSYGVEKHIVDEYQIIIAQSDEARDRMKVTLIF